MATENTQILLDIGKALPSLDETIPVETELLPGVKAIIDKNAVDAVQISHSHGDHVGLIGQVNPEIPVYIGQGALHIYNTTALFTGGNSLANPTIFFESGQPLIIGDFTVTPYLVDHSGDFRNATNRFIGLKMGNRLGYNQNHLKSGLFPLLFHTIDL